MEKSFYVFINGLVQGVGFRPFVYRLAKETGLKGWVNNLNDSVQIAITGREKIIKKFIKELYFKKPQVAEIHALNILEVPVEICEGFHIIESVDVSQKVTRICPDMGVCQQCLEDMKIQQHRIDYPFINCTNCGPRFSIIKALPYDRTNTTMQEFKMCSTCKREYRDPSDRRFHAEPIACRSCGPHYTLHNGKKKIKTTQHILQKSAELIDSGHIIIIKGIGGYLIACDAVNSIAVKNLRNRKQRYGKPFAVMFRDLSSLKKYAWLNTEEASLISGIRRPIVLLKQKKSLADGINDGLSCIGAMLPYMPFHYLLFEKLKTNVIVLTSANLTEEPIIADDNQALKQLTKISEIVVAHNRVIHNRVDDSVAFVVGGKSRMIRRSRGFAPEPLTLPQNCEGIFAAGAESYNSFAIGKDHQAFLSQHIGDLKNFETLRFYKESYDRFKQLFRFYPEMAVCDLHPDYLSTRFCESLNLPLLRIQHHHAHIASCIAEHHIDEKVIGVSFDGTGYGTDGKIWGGEFFLADLEKFSRLYHFEYVPVSGGDKAAYKPWISAYSYLNHYHLLSEAVDWIKKLNEPQFDLLIEVQNKKINCTECSSAGRLFDAIAALTGVCLNNTYQAEAPMKLEAVIQKGEKGKYEFELIGSQICFRITFKSILDDINQNVSVSVISARFHNTVAEVVSQICGIIRNDYGLNTVALTGGTFQNRYLLVKVMELLQKNDFRVISNEKVPCNDGGIALGQMAIAAKKRQDNVFEHTCRNNFS